jgi:hypothetical protein
MISKVTIGLAVHYPPDAMVFDSNSFARRKDHAADGVSPSHLEMANVAVSPPLHGAAVPVPDAYRLSSAKNAAMNSFHPTTPSANDSYSSCLLREFSPHLISPWI